MPFILFGSCEKFKNCRISCYQHITHTRSQTLTHPLAHTHTHEAGHAQLGCLSSGLGLSWFSGLGFVTVARLLRVYKFKNLFVFTCPVAGDSLPSQLEEEQQLSWFGDWGLGRLCPGLWVWGLEWRLAI